MRYYAVNKDILGKYEVREFDNKVDAQVFCDVCDFLFMEYNDRSSSEKVRDAAITIAVDKYENKKHTHIEISKYYNIIKKQLKIEEDD